MKLELSRLTVAINAARISARNPHPYFDHVQRVRVRQEGGDLVFDLGIPSGFIPKTRTVLEVVPHLGDQVETTVEPE
jgi:hypothetical protein